MYTKADLTVSSDKLVALQGIVTRIKDNLNAIPNPDNQSTKTQEECKYLAGLGETKVCFGICSGELCLGLAVAVQTSIEHHHGRGLR